MKMYLISDNVDTQKGMRLAGVTGCVIHTEDEVLEEFKKILSDKDIGLVLITEKLSKLVSSYIRELKLTKSLPLIVEIPDRHGSVDIAMAINKHVKEAIGLKL